MYASRTKYNYEGENPFSGKVQHNENLFYSDPHHHHHHPPLLLSLSFSGPRVKGDIFLRAGAFFRTREAEPRSFVTAYFPCAHLPRGS